MGFSQGGGDVLLRQKVEHVVRNEAIIRVPALASWRTAFRERYRSARRLARETLLRERHHPRAHVDAPIASMSGEVGIEEAAREAPGSATELEHRRCRLEPPMAQEQCGRAILIESLRVLQGTDAIVDSTCLSR